MMDQRRIRLKLFSIGIYSKALILPKWWVKLNDDPDEVDVDLSFGFLGIHPVRREERDKLEAKSGKQG